jgi:hypothetical protein
LTRASFILKELKEEEGFMAVAKGFLPKRSALLAEMVAAIVEEMKKNRDDLALRNSDGLRLSVLY